MLVALALLLGGLERFEAVEAHMGTLVRITLYAPDQEAARRGFAAAFARIRAIDESLSDYRPESELMRFNRTKPGVPVTLSPDLYAVLEAAQTLAAETGGAFDVTVGNLTRMWRAGRLPGEAAHAASGYRKLQLARQTAWWTEAGAALDVGGIAKGYAGDQALAALWQAGIPRALVAVSGDVVAGDEPPGLPGWRIGLPRSAEPVWVVRCAVSTSGDETQFRVIGGVRYSHILDPRTGKPLVGAPVVTVVARRGMDADATATALSVLGESAGIAWVGTRGDRAVRFAAPSGTVRESRQFRAMLTGER